ncbi:DWNN [Musa troglodytarum]|uniref:DWNN n=1 Tax=Musa troglodytarum TaxID=320322 RepID=A0A9E7GNW2_9LILI|nr:DWNN [Musa troglodytarum]
MAVYYKFKSAKDYDSIPIEGQFISVANLKERIFETKLFGKGTDFDLMISNAQTNEEYVDEGAMIPKNTSVLIRRVPGQPRKPIPEEYEWDEFGNDLYAIPEVNPAQSSNPVIDTSPANKVDEDSKIKALIDTPALDWNRQAQDAYGAGRGFGRGIGGRMMGGRGFGRGMLERKTPPADMESARPLQPKIPSPTLSVASRDEPKQPTMEQPSHKKEGEVACETKDANNEMNSLDKRSAINTNVSEATPEPLSKGPKSPESAPAPEDVQQEKHLAGDQGKKKKKKKARLPGTAGDMQWRAYQDPGAENFGMPVAASGYNPYWAGGMPLGVDGYMAPFGGPMPFMGYAPGPFDVPFGGGIFPQDPFAAQAFMMPAVPRDLSELGMGSMGMKQGPPSMSRDDFDARKADLRRKREMERFSQSFGFINVAALDIKDRQTKNGCTSCWQVVFHAHGPLEAKSTMSDRAHFMVDGQALASMVAHVSASVNHRRAPGGRNPTGR